MNVCLVNTYFKQGGAAIACTRLWEALNESGTTTNLLNFFSDNNDPRHLSRVSGKTGKLVSKFHFMKERLFFLPYEHDSVSRWNFSPANSGVDVSSHKAIQDASLIHLHWINHGFLSLKSLKELASLNKPVVWTLHDMWLFTGGCHHSRGCENFLDRCGNCQFLKKPFPDDLSSKIFSEKQKIISRLNLHVVTPSRWLAKEAARGALLKQAKISVIPNPLNLDVYKPGNKQQTKKELGIEANSKVILFMAANASSEYKGVKYLEEALKRLHHDHPELSRQVVLIAIGKIKDNSYAHFPVKTILAGTINQERTIVNYYNAADVFVLPSLEENLPNTIMEAMACGTPSVAFKTGGIPDLIDHLQNGYLAEFKSVEELTNGIVQLLSDAGLLLRLKENGRRKAEAQYSYNIISSQYKKVYEEFLLR